MKAINKFFYALLAFATVGMVACSEDATHEPGPAELEGCYGVYFPEASILETQGPMGDTSLDPSEPTTFTYYAYRENSEGEITVPVEINSTLDAEGNPMYTVEPIVFADGEEVAEFGVVLSDKAEVGVPYKLTVSVANDPQFVKQYDTANATMFSVTINRVKWIEVGQCLFVEDMVSAWYGLAIPPYEVKVEVRADSINEEAFEAALAGTGDDSGLAGIYRMVNPYEIWGQIGGITTFDANVLIYVLDASRVYIPFQKVGITINDGAGVNDVTILSDAAYDLAKDVAIEDIKPEQWGYVRNGKIGFPVDMLLGNPGGSASPSSLYYANRNGLWSLTLSPALGVYELAMPDAEEDGDFSFAEVDLPEGALFYSESQAAVYGPVLEKGRCEVSTKDADRIFYKEYGLLYRLPDLYEEGYPIYFAALEDGTVTLPKAYLSQATGLVQNGYEVMMAIDAEQSKFDPATGLMTLVAEFYSGTGEDAVSYGTFQEVIAVKAPEFPVQPVADLKNDFAYSAFYTAPMTSEFMDSEFDVDVEQGTCINPYLELDGTAYRIQSLYTNGYDIYFVADSEGNVGVTAGYELQPTGVVIYGKAAYMQILGGTCNDKTVILNAKFCDVEGNTLVPALCTETVVNYTWFEVGAGSYYSVLFGDDATQQIIPFNGRKLENAEGTNLYRIVNWVDFGADLTFTWDKTTNKCEIVGMVDTGIPSAMFGATGRSCVCDARTCLAWYDVVADWATLERNGYTQPHFDPQTLTFEFEIFYVFPDMGVGYMLNDMDGLPVPFVEAYVLDGAPSEGPKWEAVATGSWYCNVLNNPITGLTLEHKEGTNSYRVVNFLSAATGVEGKHFEFTWDQTTNLCEVSGVVDTGILCESLGIGAPGNIYFVDEKTYWNAHGYPGDTWESLQAEYGVSVQPYFNTQYNAFFFRVAYYIKDVDKVVGFKTESGEQTQFVEEVFQLDAATTTSSAVTLEKVSIAKNADAGEFTGISKYRKVTPSAKERLSQSAMKVSCSKLSINLDKVAHRSLKTATPVKRQTMFLAR